MEVRGDPSIQGMQTDEDLFALFKSGDWTAFAELVERYQAVAINYCLRHTGERPTAEDLAQDAFARLFADRQHLEFSGKGRLRAWLFRVLHNACIDHNRRSNGFVWVPFEDQLVSDLPSSECPPRQVEASAELDALKGSLRLLSPEDREILYLTVIEGLSHSETAEVMGISAISVKVKLHRARRRLMADPALRLAVEEAEEDGR